MKARRDRSDGDPLPLAKALHRDAQRVDDPDRLVPQRNVRLYRDRAVDGVHVRGAHERRRRPDHGLVGPWLGDRLLRQRRLANPPHHERAHRAGTDG